MPKVGEFSLGYILLMINTRFFLNVSHPIFHSIGSFIKAEASTIPASILTHYFLLFIEMVSKKVEDFKITRTLTKTSPPITALINIFGISPNTDRPK